MKKWRGLLQAFENQPRQKESPIKSVHITLSHIGHSKAMCKMVPSSNQPWCDEAVSLICDSFHNNTRGSGWRGRRSSHLRGNTKFSRQPVSNAIAKGGPECIRRRGSGGLCSDIDSGLNMVPNLNTDPPSCKD